MSSMSNLIKNFNENAEGNEKMTNKDLEMFKATGFFDEKSVAIQHIKDFSEILNEQDIDYCVMFGVLLGILRHQDFIPWDDDIDIVIFEYDKFLQRCQQKLEDRGYVIQADIRDGKNCGCRIFHINNSKSGLNPELGFPWIGIWVHETDESNLISFPPETIQYDPEDFFPLQNQKFLGATIRVPNNPVKVLNRYFGVEDWMEYCMPSILDHRKGGPTDFPQEKYRLTEVMSFIGK